MQIRPASPVDAPELATLHVRAWQVAYAEILPAGYLAALDIDERVERWRSRLTDQPGPTRTYVAEVADHIVGFASVGPYRSEDDKDRHIGEVYAIYAHPDAWSAGVGRALMATSIDHLSGAGCTEIRLWVFADNPRARRFYERAGFVADGETMRGIIDEGGPFETEATEVRYALRIPVTTSP